MMSANKADTAMTKVFGAFLVLLAGLGVSTVEAGFRMFLAQYRN
jgi:hypothetical protein